MKLQVIVGSTRPGRVSHKVANWVAKEAQNVPDTQVEVVDLMDYQLPFLDEPISPQYNPNRTPNEAAARWLKKVAEADAYVIVTPEYNRSYSAVLKNALDYIDFQFAQKPVAFVAHGSTGGAQAVAHLRGVLPGLLAVTVPKATFLVGRAGDILTEHDDLIDAMKADTSGPQGMLKVMLADTKWYSDALATARSGQK